MSKKWTSKADWKDRNWVYVNSANTDISKTFERVRREMEALQSKKVSENVTQMRRAK